MTRELDASHQMNNEEQELFNESQIQGESEAPLQMYLIPLADGIYSMHCPLCDSGTITIHAYLPPPEAGLDDEQHRIHWDCDCGYSNKLTDAIERCVEHYATIISSSQEQTAPGASSGVLRWPKSPSQ